MTSLVAEVAEWRRTHTWGGFLWFPDVKEKSVDRTPGEHLLDEVEWLLGGQVHPSLIAQELHRKRESILRLARKHGRAGVVEAFKLDAYEQQRFLRRAVA